MSLTGHHLSAVVWLAIDPLERVRRCTPRPAACCMLPPRCCPDACCVHHLHATTALLPRCMLRASCCPRAAACCPSPRRVLQQRFAHPAPDLSTTLHAPDFQLLTLHARHAQAKRYADAVRLLRAVRAPGPCSARAAPLGAPPRLWAQHRIAHRHRRPSLKPTLAVASLSGSSPTTLHSLSAGAGVAVRRAPARPHVQPPRTAPPPSY